MTDEQIIKMLELYRRTSNPHSYICGQAFDLINRQTATIEEIKDENAKLKWSLQRANKYGMELEDHLKATRAEAIKEFWERLKSMSTLDERIVCTRTGDNLVKEMTEEEENA